MKDLKGTKQGDILADVYRRLPFAIKVKMARYFEDYGNEWSGGRAEIGER